MAAVNNIREPWDEGAFADAIWQAGNRDGLTPSEI